MRSRSRLGVQRTNHGNALEMAGVSKVYEVGGVELAALRHVDLTVAPSEVVTLLGPSGSGKSTLLSIAGGLLSPTTGHVVVGGRDISRASPRKLTAFRRKQVGFIFQAANLVPFLTARENLLVVAELARRKPAKARQRADRLLEELGLGHRSDNLPAQLSGGERQRVAIGRALMNGPTLVLVDEPTSALDSELGQQVMELIVAEAKQREAACIIVTHDHLMTRYGDRILNIADGQIASITPRPEWTGRPAHPAAEVPLPERHMPGAAAAQPERRLPAQLTARVVVPEPDRRWRLPPVSAAQAGPFEPRTAERPTQHPVAPQPPNLPAAPAEQPIWPDPPRDVPRLPPTLQLKAPPPPRPRRQPRYDDSPRQ